MQSEIRILERLGPVPCWRGERRSLEALKSMYEKIIEKSGKALDEHRKDLV